MMANPNEFQRLFERVGSAVLTSRRLPSRVFRAGYGEFQFLEFVLFANGALWTMLQRLMAQSEDETVGVTVLDPDPSGYFYTNFKRFGAIEIPRSSSAPEYTKILNSAPESSPVDSVATVSQVLVWAPPSLRWVIWGERSPEIMVLAYRDGFNAPSTETLAQSGICPFTAGDALDISSSSWRDRSALAQFARDLLANYGHGQHWTDPAVIRALDAARKFIAGEMGTIATCRALSALRGEVGQDLEGVFETFVGVDSETDDLPVGPVRAEWNPAVLALKDIEIARCERQYRSVVLKACRELIQKLCPAESEPLT
jgi:hypothetical protein